jgi:hypothetical protein
MDYQVAGVLLECFFGMMNDEFLGRWQAAK